MGRLFERIVVIGAGKMGGALVGGWLDQGVPPGAITLVDPTLSDPANPWHARGVSCVSDISSLEDYQPDMVLLAIKPQMMGAALPALARFDDPQVVVLSVAAGTPIAALKQTFPTAACVRSMPNTPAAVGAGVTAVFGPTLDDAKRDAIDALLRAVGSVVWVESEDDMDAVTALSGSGPAYVFHLVEAMARAGESLGLPPETAMTLARQTVIGSGQLMDQSSEPASQLRVNVTSPGGTTAAGLGVLMETGRLEALMKETTQAAYDRSKALAASKPDPAT